MCQPCFLCFLKYIFFLGVRLTGSELFLYNRAMYWARAGKKNMWCLACMVNFLYFVL